MTTWLSGRALKWAGVMLLFGCTVILSIKSGDTLHYLDERDYEHIARMLVQQHEYSLGGGGPTALRPPGYPMAIAATYLIQERPLAAKFENGVFLICAVILLGVLSRRLAPASSVLVPYLVLAYPLLLYAASLLYPQVLGCLLLTVVILLLTAERVNGFQASLAGIVYGILILAIPSFLMLLPLIAAYVLVWHGDAVGGRIRITAIMLLFSGIIVIPWTLRNFVQFHHPIAVSANSGANLFIGNSPVTTANSGINADVLPLCKAVHPGMTEYGFDAAMRRCAVDWITENPGAALRLYMAKVLNYFNYRNDLATPGAGARWQDYLSFATYYPLLLLALLRAAMFRRYPFARAEALIYLIYFLNAFASAIFFTRIRFRIPFDFLLIGTNAAFLVRLLEDYRACRRNAALPDEASLSRMIP